MLEFKGDLEITEYHRVNFLSDGEDMDPEENSNKNDTQPNSQFFDQSFIKENIKSMHSKEKFLDSIGILFGMLSVNFDQTITFLEIPDLIFILNGLTDPISIEISLNVLRYIILSPKHLSGFYQIISDEHFQFFENIGEALTDSSLAENVKINIIDFLRSLVKFNEIRMLFAENNIFQFINQLANVSEQLDTCISIFYNNISYYSFCHFTPLVFEYIFPLIFDFCQHKNMEIVSISLESLRLFMQTSFIWFNAIISNSIINILVGYIELKDFPLVQENSIRILISCIQYQEFPLDLIFELKLIDKIFSVLKYCNETLSDLFIGFFRSILQKSDKDRIQEVINYFIQYDFLNSFSFKAFETKVKIIDIFNFLIVNSTPENSTFFCSKCNVEFLLDMMVSSEDLKIAKDISCIFNFVISRYQSDQNFVSYFISIVSESDCQNYLSQILSDSIVKPDEIVFFLRNIQMMRKRLDELNSQ